MFAAPNILERTTSVWYIHMAGYCTVPKSQVWPLRLWPGSVSLSSRINDRWEGLIIKGAVCLTMHREGEPLFENRNPLCGLRAISQMEISVSLFDRRTA